MIEIVSKERCVTCDVCVAVCPTNVFDTGPDGIPVIARQDDCQTCFMCEAHCPADALFPSANSDMPSHGCSNDARPDNTCEVRPDERRSRSAPLTRTPSSETPPVRNSCVSYDEVSGTSAAVVEDVEVLATCGLPRCVSAPTSS